MNGARSIIIEEGGSSAQEETCRRRTAESGRGRGGRWWSCIWPAAALALLAFGVVKNIGHPLLWNDEGETAMFARRVLDYGYPKVHDGKNVVYMMELPDRTAGIDLRRDAYIGSGWGHFYFGALGEMAARRVDDPYLKTALLRLPFALAGLAGIVLMAAAAAPLFGPSRYHRRAAITAFFLLEALSVPLALHLREMRYYALVIFLAAAILFLYMRRTAGRLRPGPYIVLTTAALWLLNMTFPAAFFPVLAALGIGEGARVLTRATNVQRAAGTLLPAGCACLLAVPTFLYFRTFSIAVQYAVLFPSTAATLKQEAFKVFRLFWTADWLPLILAVKTVSLVLWAVWRLGGKKGGFLGPAERRKIAWSSGLTVYALLHAAVVIRAAFPVTYDRYVIVLQPVFALILILDSAAVWGVLASIRPSSTKRAARLGFAGVLAILTVLTGAEKSRLLRERAYELFHAPVGPMDTIVDFIRSRYPNPEHLVIATNYEEPVLMYYLGSRVIFGYVGNNLEADRKAIPDVIVLRRRSAPTNGEFIKLLGKAGYRPVEIRIEDSWTNTSPEVSPGDIRHRFRTVWAKDRRRAPIVYVMQ